MRRANVQTRLDVKLTPDFLTERDRLIHIRENLRMTRQRHLLVSECLKALIDEVSSNRQNTRILQAQINAFAQHIGIDPISVSKKPKE